MIPTAFTSPLELSKNDITTTFDPNSSQKATLKSTKKSQSCCKYLKNGKCVISVISWQNKTSALESLWIRRESWKLFCTMSQWRSYRPGWPFQWGTLLQSTNHYKHAQIIIKKFQVSTLFRNHRFHPLRLVLTTTLHWFYNQMLQLYYLINISKLPAQDFSLPESRFIACSSRISNLLSFSINANEMTNFWDIFLRQALKSIQVCSTSHPF